jgi:hypothetical protein
MPQPSPDGQPNPDTEQIILGVDTHKDIHVAALITTLGVQLADATSTTTAWSFRPYVNLGSGNATVSRYLLADFDGNGRPDLAAYTADGDSLYFSRNTSSPGSPSKGPGQLVSSGWATVDHTMIADWDGDGKDDILGRNGDSMLIWRSTSTTTAWSLRPYVNLGSGNATVSEYLTNAPSH